MSNEGNLLKDRDTEWESILQMCENTKDFEALADLQALVDNTFDLLDNLREARKSLLKSLAALDKLAANAAASYGDEWDVVDSLVEDIDNRERWATKQYFKQLENLLS